MKKNTKVISFVASKGGPGKTTLMSVIMNYLHNKTDLDIVLIETDWVQQTLFKTRRDELREAEEALRQLNALVPDDDLDEEELAEWNKNLEDQKKEHTLNEDDMYDIFVVHPKDVPQVVVEELQGEVDIVFIDVPGNLGIENVIDVYEVVDLILVPTKYGRPELLAFMDIMKILEEHIMPKAKETGKKIQVYGVLNNFNPAMREYTEYVENKGNMPIPFLKTDIPRGDVAFVRGFSTHKMYNFPSRPTLVKEFCEEILEIMNH